VKKLILIFSILSIGIICNGDTYEYSGQNYPDNVHALKLAIEAESTFSGITWQYVDFYGEDLSNCNYKVTADRALDSTEQTTLANLISTYNVSGWAEITAILIYEYYAKVA